MEQFAQGTTVMLDIFIYEYYGGPLTDPDGYPTTEPTVQVRDPSGAIMSTGLATRVSIGRYEYSYLLPATAPIGSGWSYRWLFAIASVTMPVEQRTEYFEAVNATSIGLLDLRTDVRIKLKDTHPDKTKRKYTNLELDTYIMNALWDLNGSPPAFTYFTLENWEENVPQWKSLITQGAMIFAMISQGIFEIGKEFSYSDNGISITIDRSGKYQNMANMLMQVYQKQKELTKKAYFMHTVRPNVIVGGELDRKIRTYAPSMWRIR